MPVHAVFISRPDSAESSHSWVSGWSSKQGYSTAVVFFGRYPKLEGAYKMSVDLHVDTLNQVVPLLSSLASEWLALSDTEWMKSLRDTVEVADASAEGQLVGPGVSLLWLHFQWFDDQGN
jgi:hypothetical protein